jgi:hypothetical protein
VNPYIVVDGAERLIDFLVEVFGGVEQGRSLRLMAASSMAIRHLPCRPGRGRNLDPGPYRSILGRSLLRLRRPIRQPVVGRDPSPRLLLTTTSVLSATGRRRITCQTDPTTIDDSSTLERLIK